MSSDKRKVCWIDTNVVLRYLLRDNEQHFEIVRNLFLAHEKGTIQVICLSQVITEVVHVLASFYQISHNEISLLVGGFVKSAPIEIENRSSLCWIMSRYSETKLGIVDLLLIEQAKGGRGEVFSFDKKLMRYQKRVI